MMQILQHRRKAFRGGGGSSSLPFAAASTPYGAVNVATGNTNNPITLASGLTNGYIVAWVSFYDGAADAVTSVSFDGSSMTELLGAGMSAGTRKAYLFGLAVGSKGAGTYSIQVNTSGPIEVYTHGIIAYNGAHQTVQDGAVDGASGTSIAPTVTIASTTGDLVVSTLYSDDAGSLTPGADQTERQQLLHDGSGGAYSDENGTTSTVASYTKGTSSPWLIIAVSLKPAP